MICLSVSIESQTEKREKQEKEKDTWKNETNCKHFSNNKTENEPEGERFGFAGRKLFSSANYKRFNHEEPSKDPSKDPSLIPSRASWAGERKKRRTRKRERERERERDGESEKTA